MNKTVVTITILGDDKGTNVTCHVKGVATHEQMMRAVITFAFTVKQLMEQTGDVEAGEASGRVERVS